MFALDTPEANALLAKDYKLAFFDIDGTLLGLDGHYTQRVRKAVLALREAGIKTAVASGRPQFAARFLIDELKLIDMGVFYTGALVQQPDGDTLACHPLTDEDVSLLIASGRELALHTELCAADRYFVAAQTELGLLHSEHLRSIPQCQDLAALVGQFPVIKMLFASTTPEEEERLRTLEARLPHLVFAYAKMAAKPEWLFASVISQQACKHTAFDRVLSYHGVTSDEVMSFGDAHSDMIFLQRAGLGVAMGNASDDVKAISSMVTLPVWEDGVAVVIERFLATR